jgi:hypothetical protein
MAAHWRCLRWVATQYCGPRVLGFGLGALFAQLVADGLLIGPSQGRGAL